MIDDLLKILGEAWTEIEALKQENARLVSMSRQAAASLVEPVPAAPAAPPVQHGYETGTILLVDDSKLLLMRYRSILEPLGYRVVGMAEDGRQGISMALRLKPELVVCDYQMPEMDGLGFIRALRASLPDAKVIICTGTTNAEPMRQFVAEGASAIVVKPIQLETFVRAVKKCMGMKLA